MAITWGAWEYSGGNGMRVGIEVDWATPSHGTTSLDADVLVYTQNQYTYGDGQTLNYGGSISGSTDFTNDEGSTAVQRANKDYNYSYSSTSYGTSPSTKTFTATLSGAYNGVTPSVSVSSPVPARPYAAPAAPNGVTASRSSDSVVAVSWNNNATAGEPYTSQTLQRRVNGGAWATVSSSISGSASSYNDSVTAGNKYEYQIRGNNSIGSSSYVASNAVYTTPAAPSGASRSGANGANQVITWTDNAAYAEHDTEVWVSANDAAFTLLATVSGPSPVSTYTHTGPPSAATRWKYKVRHKTRSGTTLYSAFSPETSQTTGATSAPSAPTNLSPTGGETLNQKVATVLTWQHNPTDTTAQTKYTVRHRVVGNPTWTTTADTASATSSYSLPANTYAGGQNIEWQVRTFGADATASAYSSSATFTTLAVVPKLPVVINQADGSWEYGSTIQAGDAGAVGTLLVNDLGGNVKMFDNAADNASYLSVGGSSDEELRINRNQILGLNNGVASPVYLNHAGGGVIIGAGAGAGDTAKLDNSTQAHLQIGGTSGENLVFDQNEIMARSNGAAAPLYLQNEGGSVVTPDMRPTIGSLANTTETSTNTGYEVLTNQSPASNVQAVAVTPGSGAFMVIVNGEVSNATAGNSSRLGFEVRTGSLGSGTQLVAPADERAASCMNSQYATCARIAVVSPGAAVGTTLYFRLMKKSGNGTTASFRNFSINVIPLP